MSKITDYFKEVKVEMSHVSWPGRKQAIVFTGVVILLSFGVALYLGLADFIFHSALGKLIN